MLHPKLVPNLQRLISLLFKEDRKRKRRTEATPEPPATASTLGALGALAGPSISFNLTVSPSKPTSKTKKSVNLNNRTPQRKKNTSAKPPPFSN